MPTRHKSFPLLFAIPFVNHIDRSSGNINNIAYPIRLSHRKTVACTAKIGKRPQYTDNRPSERDAHLLACRLPFKIKQAENELDKAIKYYTAAEFPMRYHPEGGHTHFRQPKGRPHKEAAAKTTADKTECAVLNVRCILQGKPKGTHSFLPARSPQHGRENHDRRKRLPTDK